MVPIQGDECVALLGLMKFSRFRTKDKSEYTFINHMSFSRKRTHKITQCFLFLQEHGGILLLGGGGWGSGAKTHSFSLFYSDFLCKSFFCLPLHRKSSRLSVAIAVRSIRLSVRTQDFHS